MIGWRAGTQLGTALVCLLTLASGLGCGRTPLDAEDDAISQSGARDPRSPGTGRPDGGDPDTHDAGPRLDGAGGSPAPRSRERCGDGTIEDGEQCDGFDFGELSCARLGLGDGRLSCTRACTIDTSGCEHDRRTVPPEGPRTRACLAQTRALAPSLECADELCACDPEATLRCGERCWELLRCVNETCDPSDVACITANCDVRAATAGLPLLRCPVGRRACGLFDGRLAPPRCGNGRIDAGEACDGRNLEGLTCGSFGLSGPLGCDAACRLDFGGCTPPPASCGNGQLDTGEQCDGDALPERTCADLGLGSGTLRCSPRCALDASGCEPDAACGNGRIDPGEQCDRGELRGRSCASFGLSGDGLTCSPLCQLDLAACDAPPICGDGIVNGDEACDGDPELTCEDHGFSAGAIRCSARCQHDVSGCTQCGNGTAESDEACDQDDLRSQTCRTLGFSGGSLACDAACGFDTAGCARCGNGSIDPGEACDGTQLAGASCGSLGLTGGTLACDPRTCLYDTRACEANMDACGNGVLESGEDCDGMDLASVDCQMLGFDGGELACNQDTCRYDRSACRFDVPEPAPSCMECGQARCSAVIDTCASDELCLSGMACLAERCGPDASVDCALQCFRGSPESAITAVSMFSCVVSQCGNTCIGTF